MASLYTHQSSNIYKTWLLMTAFFLLIMALGWGVSYYFQQPSLFVIAVVFALVMNFWSYWFSDSVALSLSHAKPADDTRYRELHRIVENLSITAGLPKPRVYVIEDAAPNAFATGRDPKHSAIAVTTGLLAIMDRNELEGVLAHELSHIGNRDILVATVAVVLVGMISLLVDFLWRTTAFAGNRDDKNGGAIAAVVLILGSIIASIAATLLQLAISRRREFLADASGALLTRYPEGLASALRKIGGYAQPMEHANSATAHLFLSSPFGPTTKKNFIANLLSTHPPIEDRIKALVG